MTTERPTQEGFYWMDCPVRRDGPTVVEINNYGVGLVVSYTGVESEDFLADAAFDGAYWSGPLPIPSKD